MSALHEKYRPRKFDEVVGQAAAVKSLARVIEKQTSRSFLFIGPSGVGKTTLARIASRVAGCDHHSITEIDAATNSGVDAMRKVSEAIQYKPFGEKDKRATIIDECHGLSKQAWDSLLKVLEEPPKHALWFLCTTDPRKVPPTIKTRCVTITLKAVDDRYLRDLVEEVADLEKMKVGESIVDLIVRQAFGSPRQALVNLATCDGVKDKREAAELLSTVLENDATIELCRFFFQGGSWSKVATILAKLDKDNPEGVRIVVCNYYASVLKNAKSEKDVMRALSIIEAFSTPYNQAEGMAPLYLSVGRVMYP